LKGLIKACAFESLSKASKWYFTGESFAGKYIPAIVYDIL
jgi:carboxypeptidase C (cathepsin A)